MSPSIWDNNLRRCILPGAALKHHRLLVRALAAKVLGKALKKDENSFESEMDANLLLCSAPDGFQWALELLHNFDELDTTSSPTPLDRGDISGDLTDFFLNKQALACGQRN